MPYFVFLSPVSLPHIYVAVKTMEKYREDDIVYTRECPRQTLSKNLKQRYCLGYFAGYFQKKTDSFNSKRRIRNEEKCLGDTVVFSEKWKNKRRSSYPYIETSCNMRG